MERGGPARRLSSLAQRVDHLSGVLPAAMGHRLAFMTEHLHGREELLKALSYKRVLGRGFSITRIKKGQSMVRSTDQLKDRTRLVTELADGVFESEVVNLNQLELFD